MEYLIIIVGVVIYIIVAGTIQKEKLDKLKSTLLTDYKNNYAENISEGFYEFFYDNESEKARIIRLSEKKVLFDDEINNIYVSKISMFIGGYVYIDKIKEPNYIATPLDTAFVVDDKHKKLFFIEYKSDCSNVTIIDFKDIITVEVCEDGNTVFSKSALRTVGGAAVGSALLGGAGAVVGGLSGDSTQKRKIKKISIKILMRDITKPAFEFVVFDLNSVSSVKDSYKSLMKYTDSIKDCISVIIDLQKSNIETQNTVSVTETKSEDKSITDELLKLAKLKEEGMLTDEEFALMKAKLLA